MKVLKVLGVDNEEILEIAVNVVGDDFTLIPPFPVYCSIVAITLTEKEGEMIKGH